MIKVCLLLFFTLIALDETKSQINDANYIVVTILSKTNEGLHKRKIDYWLISLSEWTNSSDKAIVPLYFLGYSNQDKLECSNNKNIIFFNQTKDETYTESIENEKTLSLINNSSFRVSKARIKTFSRKKTIEVFFTLVKGDFDYCNAMKYDGSYLLENRIQIAIPNEVLILDAISKDMEKLLKKIAKYDFFKLPYVGIHTIQ